MELYIGGFAQGKLEYVQNKKAEEAISIAMVIDCAQSDYQKTVLLQFRQEERNTLNSAYLLPSTQTAAQGF